MAKLRLSYSSIKHFFESRCPASWYFYQTLSPKEINEFAERGLLVHRILEGTVPPVDADEISLGMAAKLTTVADMLGIEIVEREISFKMILPEVSEVEFSGRIDVKGTIGKSKKPVLVDWKTGGGNWKSFAHGKKEIVPQALSMQGAIYTSVDKPRWPKDLYYLIVGFRGAPQVLKYTRTSDSYLQLVRAALLVRDAAQNASNLPKIYGKHCLECAFRDACYKTPGWKAKYEKRPDSQF